MIANKSRKKIKKMMKVIRWHIGTAYVGDTIKFIQVKRWSVVLQIVSQLN